MFFKQNSSGHSLQQRFDAKKRSRTILEAVAALIMALFCFVVGVLIFPRAAYSLIELLTQKSVVNINYGALFLLGGVPGSYFLGMAGWSTLFYRRVLVPSEMKPFFAKTLKWSVALSLICSLGVGGTLSLLTVPLIWHGGYSHCSEMTEGSGWDSYWVKDKTLCTSSR
ncbi:hypothetical protein [Salinicola sp. CPA57]|uniref:hypothetical protein n=1 Tax=Salinicola sp. CPA57 TaxID=1949080 RepID=UPI001300A215|nr:hypothetical protein [Salinicola sp. CPA57]